MGREKAFGVTWHVMSGLVDAGDILKQYPLDIADDDTALTLNAKCYEAAIRSFAELIDDLGGSIRKPRVHVERGVRAGEHFLDEHLYGARCAGARRCKRCNIRPSSSRLG
jgi:hypothetical protein